MATIDKTKYAAASSAKSTTPAKGYTKEQVQQAQGKSSVPAKTSPPASPQMSEEQTAQMIQEIIKMLQQGAKPEDILAKLIQGGIPQAQAQQLIQQATDQLQSQGQSQATPQTATSVTEQPMQ